PGRGQSSGPAIRDAVLPVDFEFHHRRARLLHDGTRRLRRGACIHRTKDHPKSARGGPHPPNRGGVAGAGGTPFSSDWSPPPSLDRRRRRLLRRDWRTVVLTTTQGVKIWREEAK